MNLTGHFRRQFSYDAWANREVLSAIRAQGRDDGRSLQLLSHILAAERLWLERLKQQPQSTPVWPERDLEPCETEANEMARLWSAYLDALAEDDLAPRISYKNSKGEQWESAVGDILNHVVMHSAYHRGQIASHMRERGQTPAYTDFIHGVRQGLVE
ncbi:MAG: DinB family protein [Candidatus Sulfotelmatobacter sp.]